MEQLLYVREICVRFYKQYEVIFLFALKFLAGLLIFNVIMAYGSSFTTVSYLPQFAPLFAATSGLRTPFMLLCAILFAISPPVLACTLAVLVFLAQISASIIPMVFVGLLLILVLVLYCRVSPERCLLIFAVLIGYEFGLVYGVVVFAALYFGLSSIIPVTIGVFIHSFEPFFTELIAKMPGSEVFAEDITRVPAEALDVYTQIFEAVTNDFSWIYPAFIFALCIIIVFAVSRLFVDYCVEMAVGAGSVVMIIGFLIAGAEGIGMIILLVLLSAVLTEFLHLFDIVLDYNKAEQVQFEDDENFYHVKIVPKISVPIGVISRKPRSAREERPAKPAKRDGREAAEAREVRNVRDIMDEEDDDIKPARPKRPAVRAEIRPDSRAAEKFETRKSDDIRREVMAKDRGSRGTKRPADE